MKRRAQVYKVYWCNYDNLPKIVWTIGKRRTNNFSAGTKRIGKNVSSATINREMVAAQERAAVAADYLNGKLNRWEAVGKLKNNILCPESPEEHLLTLAEIALGLRKKRSR